MPEDRHSGLPGGGGGANVKSGIENAITCGTERIVTFGTAFASTPRVVGSFEIGENATDIVFILTLSTTGFTIRVHKAHGGSTHSQTVHWIATDAGDP